MSVRILEGDCREVLATLDAESVQCCVTSPPYWGLRDYGHGDQLGLEKTPEQYVEKMVAVFREVRRVLRPDGTLWLNIGDSYAVNGGARAYGSTDGAVGRGDAPGGQRRAPSGIKAKDLVGIPWMLAFALRQPYYTGSIRNESDRIWLAAMLDAEGCLFIHKRKAGQHNGQGYHRKNDNYGPGIEISNTHRAVVERIAALAGKGSICEQESGKFGRKQTLYRWNLRTTESREFVRELYPYLIAKQQQARILCGCPTSGEQAEAAHAALIGLHRGEATTVDFPAPRPMYEPGFYLRSDVIWSKCNPMPESVTDRPTKAHEYLFLLTKSASYYYDAEAIKEDAAMTSWATRLRMSGAREQQGPKMDSNEWNGQLQTATDPTSRNRRTVWTIATSPFPGAHFAVMPPKLVEPCILAGSKRDDTVLDPFAGAGTVGLVASRLGRSFVGIELNPEYAKMARARIYDDAPLFQPTEAA